VCLLAEGAVALQDAEAAAELRPALERYPDHHAQVGLAFYLGPVPGFAAGLAALTGDRAAAVAHHEAALRAVEAIDGAVTTAARLRAAYGALLAGAERPQDCARARELLEASRSTAGALGMRGVDADASAALERMASDGG
jgi:hypothetical protein